MKHLLTILTAFFLLALCVPCHAIQELIKQSSATTKVPFLLVDSATGQTGQTGKGATMAIEVSINGASGSGYAGSAPTEIDSTNLPGDYYYVPTATETGTLGVVTLHITCASCQTVDLSCQVVAFDPNSSTNLGLSALPSANPAASGGLPTVNSSNQVAGVSGNVGGSVASVTAPVVASSVTGAVGSVTGPVTVTGTPSVNVVQIAGQTASAAAGVTFPASIGTSTYAGADTSGTTTLLGRLPQTLLFDGSGFIKANTETNSDKTNYSLSQLFPANFATLAIDGSGYTTFNNTAIANVTNQVTANVTDINGHAPLLDASNNLKVDTYWIDAQTLASRFHITNPSRPRGWQRRRKRLQQFHSPPVRQPCPLCHPPKPSSNVAHRQARHGTIAGHHPASDGRKSG